MPTPGDLGVRGYIIKDRQVIGEFDYSFGSCRYSWCLYGSEYHHYYSDKEMLEEKARNGWKYVSPSEVKITREYVGR